MPVEITPNQLISLFHRHTHLVGWLAFAVFNNLLITITLFVFWAFELDRHTAYRGIEALSLRWGLKGLWSALSFLGLSGLVIFSLYALLWRKIWMKLSLNYLSKNIKKYEIT